MEPKQLSKSEKHLLISLVNQHKAILNDKSHNVYIIGQKKEIWSMIEKSFNASHLCQAPKTSKQLQKSWDNYKTRAKKIAMEKEGRKLCNSSGDKMDGISESSNEMTRVMAITDEIRQLYETGDCDTQRVTEQNTPDEIINDLCMHSVFAQASSQASTDCSSSQKMDTDESGHPSKRKSFKYTKPNQDDERTIMILRKRLLENQLRAQEQLHELEKQTKELQMQTAAIKLQQAKNELSISQIEFESKSKKSSS